VWWKKRGVESFTDWGPFGKGRRKSLFRSEKKRKKRSHGAEEEKMSSLQGGGLKGQNEVEMGLEKTKVRPGWRGGTVFRDALN